MTFVGSRRALLAGYRRNGLMVWSADDLLADTKALGPDGQALTFTPGMAKRAVTVPAGGSLVAPIIQGHLVKPGAGDIITASTGTAIMGAWRDSFDPYQMTISFWHRPEYAGNDGLFHHPLFWDQDCRIVKKNTNALEFRYGGEVYPGPAVSWAASDWVHIIIRLSTSNKLDGINYVSFTVNDAHAYTGAVAPTADDVTALYVGGWSTGTYTSDGLISDLHIFRRILTDGDNTIPAPEGASADEIAALYASGAGAPASTVIVDYGESCVFALPTNGTAGAFATGSTDAIMAPLRADNKLTDWHCQTTYGSSGWSTVGTPAAGPADSTVRIFGSQAYGWNPDAADEGIKQAFVVVAGQNYSLLAWPKDNNDFAVDARVRDATGAADIVTLSTSVSGIYENLGTCFKVPAGCISVEVYIESTDAAQDSCRVNQVVLYSNLVDNGGLEGTYIAGLAPGWTKNGTPTVAEVAGRTGAAAQQVTDSEDTGKSVYQDVAVTSGNWYHVSGWARRSGGTGESHIRITDAVPTNRYLISSSSATWARGSHVFKADSTNLRIWLMGTDLAAIGEFDDIQVHELDDVSLTVTPATEANSRESMAGTQWGTADTLRVDGDDGLTFPVSDGILRAAEGTIMFWTKARHATAWADELLFDAGGASPNAFSIRRVATTNVLHIYYGDQNDASTATIADINHHHIVWKWKDGTCYLYIDAVLAAGFALTGAAIPTLNATAYIGSTVAGTLQADAAILGMATSLKALPHGRIIRAMNLTRPWILGDM